MNFHLNNINKFLIFFIALFGICGCKESNDTHKAPPSQIIGTYHDLQLIDPNYQVTRLLKTQGREVPDHLKNTDADSYIYIVVSDSIFRNAFEEAQLNHHTSTNLDDYTQNHWEKDKMRAETTKQILTNLKPIVSGYEKETDISPDAYYDTQTSATLQSAGISSKLEFLNFLKAYPNAEAIDRATDKLPKTPKDGFETNRLSTEFEVFKSDWIQRELEQFFPDIANNITIDNINTKLNQISSDQTVTERNPEIIHKTLISILGELLTIRRAFPDIKFSTEKHKQAFINYMNARADQLNPYSFLISNDQIHRLTDNFK